MRHDAAGSVPQSLLTPARVLWRGSGVFAVPGTAESTAITFYGVAWGGTDEDTAFSAVYNIEADLGVLRVH